MGSKSIHKYCLAGCFHCFVSILYQRDRFDANLLKMTGIFLASFIKNRFISEYSRLIVQTFVFILNLVLYDKIRDQLSTVWPIVLLLIGSVLIVFVIVEFCKWQELK